MSRLVLVGRLSRSQYMSNGRIVERTEFRLLKRKSIGVLIDLIIDEEYDISSINLSSYEPGLYELRTCNETYDIESGYCDGYDLKLTPYSEDVL